MRQTPRDLGQRGQPAGIVDGAIADLMRARPHGPRIGRTRLARAAQAEMIPMGQQQHCPRLRMAPGQAADHIMSADGRLARGRLQAGRHVEQMGREIRPCRLIGQGIHRLHPTHQSGHALARDIGLQIALGRGIGQGKPLMPPPFTDHGQRPVPVQHGQHRRRPALDQGILTHGQRHHLRAHPRRRTVQQHRHAPGQFGARRHIAPIAPTK
jgi:hypothetical protein